MLSQVSPEKGTLLISEPFMSDPNFKRTVVLLVENRFDGVVGYVLNQKSDLLLKDLVPECWDANMHVYVGGPVSTDTLHFVHCIPHIIIGGSDLGNGLFWGGDFDNLKTQINNYQVKDSDILKICAAKIPAFFAAFNATVATGMPFGICRIDRTESHPSIELLDFTGTPMTGSEVIDATIPGR